MAIRNSKELAVRLRQNAADCEQASEQVRPEYRTRLINMAQHYRMLAERAEAPMPIREPSPTGLAADAVAAAPIISDVEKSSIPPGLAELASLFELWSIKGDQATNNR